MGWDNFEESNEVIFITLQKIILWAVADVATVECCDENWKYCAKSGTRTHIFCIPGQCTRPRLPDVFILSMRLLA